MKRITVLGGGAWGTAIAWLLADNGHIVTLWCHEQSVADDIQVTRINQRYLPGIALSPLITATTSLEHSLKDAHWIFEAIPIVFMRSVLESAKPFYASHQIWVITSKGMEKTTLMLPSQIIDDVFGFQTQKTVLAGPSFAADLVKKQITGVAIASSIEETAQALQHMLSNNYFRPYISHDMIGVQAGGALKNIIAIGVGILDGAGYTDNAKAYLLTLGLHEMAQLVNALGGNQETVYGLSGMGDLVLTSMSALSKNMTLGRRLGTGASLATIAMQMGTLPEGVNTVQSVHQLTTRLNMQLPICNGIYEIMFAQKSIDTFLQECIKKS